MNRTNRIAAVAALLLACAAGLEGRGESKMFLEPGRLELGANYWSSFNATKMWREWRPDEIEKDFVALKEHGMTTLRVFPTWSDFQPIVEVHANCALWNKSKDTRMTLDEKPRPQTEAGYAGVDETMLRRFEEFCDLAEKHGMRLVVAIMTGQMTFRNFIPPALENRNPYSDPYALAWEGRFIECFVNRMKGKKAIVAWESGNESRALCAAESKEQGEWWLRYIHSVIRVADPTRPVISVDGFEIAGGMWQVRENAHLSDYVPHHLYALWRRENPDRFDGIRNLYFAAAGVKGLEDISGKPSFLEEHGARRAEQVSRARLAKYMRPMLWNLWAADGKAMLWWCAFDQTKFEFAPYNWPEPCLELGILKEDRTPHPAALAMKRFAAFQKRIGLALPKARPDAVVFTQDTQVEKLVHASYVLARQAGIMPKFANPADPIPDAKCYFLPCAAGRAHLTTHNWEALKAKVRGGATLYISWSETFLPAIEEVCGMELDYRETIADKLDLAFDLGDGKPFKYAANVTKRRHFITHGAEVLAKNANGEPFFFRNRYGKGLVYTLGLPLEQIVHSKAGGYAGNAHRIWQAVCPVRRLFESGSSLVNASEHFLPDGRCAVVVVNNSPESYAGVPKIMDGWTVDSVATDDETDVKWTGRRLELGANAGAILMLRKAGDSRARIP